MVFIIEIIEFRENFVDINRFYSSVICIILCILQETIGYNQICVFKNETQYPDTVSKPYEQIYYSCVINNADLKLANQKNVSTITTSNKQANVNVQRVHYSSSSIVEFIPASIYKTFPKLERLAVDSNKIEIPRPHYFNNATNLKVIKMVDGIISELVDDVFQGAPRLEYINFKDNEITSIHRHAFRGLKYVMGIFLKNNKITNIHYETFSGITHLTKLDLRICGCVNITFQVEYSNFIPVEVAIKKTCTYFPSISNKVYHLEDKVQNNANQIEKNSQDNSKIMLRFNILLVGFLVFVTIILVLGIAILIMEVKNGKSISGQNTISP